MTFCRGFTVTILMMHATQVLDGLAMLRRENTLCDVVLQAQVESASCEVVGGARTVWAHRVVLAAASPYFLAMFTKFKEATESVITIQEVEPAALQAVVEYIYSPTSLTVTADNAQALLSAASLLNVGGVRDAAQGFLEGALSADNVLGIRAFAERHACAALAATAKRYLDRHFERVFQSDEFLALSPDALAALLDNLAVSSEEHVLDSVLLWMQYRLQERQQHLHELLRHVRLPRIPHEVLAERACAEPLASAKRAVQRQLVEAMAFHLQRPERRALTAAGSDWYQSRLPRASALLVVGGEKKYVEYTRDVLVYELSSGRWQSAAALPKARYKAGVALVDDSVYVVGGYDGGRYQSSVSVLDVSRGSWTAGPSLCSARGELAVAELGGRLYAAGGKDSNNTVLSSVEALDPREGVWRPVARMAAGRWGVGAAALDGRMYAAGGYDERVALNTVERYDPSADRWEPAESMAQGRYYHGVVAVEDTLYVVGGRDGSTRFRSVERYRVGSRWEPAPSMTAARSSAAVTTHAGRMYVAGGVDEGEDRLCSVAVFDPATAAWSELPAAMPEERVAAVAVVVDWPPPAP